jgi:hypothetical protein
VIASVYVCGPGARFAATTLDAKVFQPATGLRLAPALVAVRDAEAKSAATRAVASRRKRAVGCIGTVSFEQA